MIELNKLNKEIILILLICKELQLNFKEIKKLYFLNNKVFWKYLYTFFNGLKMSEDRFLKLSNISEDVYNNIVNPNTKISSKYLKYLEYVKLRIEDRFECNNNNLYDLEDFINYINNKNVFIDILLYNGDYIKKVGKADLNYYKRDIYKVIITKNKEKEIFTRTCEYSFITKDKNEIDIYKINIINKKEENSVRK